MSLLNPTVCGFAKVAIYEMMMEKSNLLVVNNKTNTTGEILTGFYEKFCQDSAMLMADFEFAKEKKGKYSQCKP